MNGQILNRPRFHFTAKSGWINDPNGLVFDGKLWHLFAQHAPLTGGGDPQHGAMHWLHAVSGDLLNWAERGIILAPDEFGEPWSGSGFRDEEGQLWLMYTSHGEREQQCLARFTEGAAEKIPQNPVIPNSKLRNFRDPKVFKNPALGGYSAVIAAGDAFIFYHSRDLFNWRQTSVFQHMTDGCLECPDLLHINNVFVLIFSVNRKKRRGGSVTRYIIGDFDGYKFTAKSEDFALDSGTDNYAAMSFFDTNIQLGWANNWAYAGQTPANNWRGMMTLPRRLSLIDTVHGKRLAQRPVLPQLQEKKTLKNKGFYVLNIESDGDFVIRLKNPSGLYLEFGCKNDEFFINRAKASQEMPKKFFQPQPAYNAPKFACRRTKRLGSGKIKMRLVFDSCVAELFADDGLFAATTLVFPDCAYDEVYVVEGSAEVSVESGVLAES